MREPLNVLGTSHRHLLSLPRTQLGWGHDLTDEVMKLNNCIEFTKVDRAGDF